MKIQNIINNYLNSGLSEKSYNHAIINQVRFINLFSVIGTFNLLFFGILNLIASKFSIGFIEVTFAAMGALNVIYMRRTLNHRFAGSVILIFMIPVLLILFVHGGTAGTGIFWFFTYPLLALFIRGIRYGLYYLLAIFILTALITFLAEINLIPSLPYSLIEIRQFYFAMLAVTMLVLFYENVHSHSENLLKKAEKEAVLKNIFDTQYELAGKIQKSFVPHKDLYFPQADIIGFYKPAMIIGGDYFDFFTIDKKHVAVLICDVAGKGIPAALIMVKVRTYLRSFLTINQKILDPSYILTELNRFMYNEFMDDIFVTMQFLIINLYTKEIKFSNAGHGPLLAYQEEKGEFQNYECPGIPLGLEGEGITYKEVNIFFHANDFILLYTDGLSDLRDRNARPLDFAKFHDKLKKISSLNANEISQNIVQDMNSYLKDASQKDDITFIVVKFK